MILVHFLETLTYLTGEVGREYFRKHLIWNLLELPSNTDLHNLSEHFFSSDNKVHCQVKKIHLEECLKRRKWKDRWPFTWESTMTALKCLIAITKWSFHGKKPILSSTGTGRALKANWTPVAPGVLKPWHDTEYTENKMQIQEYLLHLTTMITL